MNDAERQREAEKDRLRQSYRRPAFEGPRETWMPLDANDIAIEQRVNAEARPAKSVNYPR